MSSEKPAKDKASGAWPWVSIGVVIGAGLFSCWGWFAARTSLASMKQEQIGQWGDSFGPMTGLATTLALVFAIWSVFMQRRELELQRDELRAARTEMRRQRKAQQKSAAAQEAANRIANLANAIAVEQALVANMSTASQAAGGSGAASQVLWAFQGKPVKLEGGTSNHTGAMIAFTVERVQSLRALQGKLEPDEPIAGEPPPPKVPDAP